MWFLLFLTGLFVGSFLNLLSDRLPKGEDVLFGRSHCDFCKKSLRWYELIPVISFILQGGRCRRCHKKLSIRYPIAELVTGVVFAVVTLLYGWNFASGGLIVLSAALIVLFLADLNYQILPDSMIVVGVLATVAYYYFTGPLPRLLPNMLTGAAASGFFYLLFAVTRGRGMGLGDVKFAFLMGLFLGYPLTVAALYVAFLTGAVVGVILIMNRRVGWKSHIAFGPFLILGMISAFIWSGQFIKLWHTFL